MVVDGQVPGYEDAATELGVLEGVSVKFVALKMNDNYPERTR